MGLLITQTATAQNSASTIGMTHAFRIAQDCLDNRWESATCLKRISESTLVMASNYAATLKESRKLMESKKLEQHCAAATAAAKQEYPAYAMRSAYTECANAISDIAGATNITPDLSQYQLLVGAVQCLDKTTACLGIEQGLAQFR